MKYKDIVIKQLDILANRLEGLKTSIENNKPMTSDELVRQLTISISTVEQLSEKVSLEDNDYARVGVGR
jgi:hypothetical protein